MQGLNEIRHQTNVASRPACVLGFFDREYPRKCIERRKRVKIGVRVVDVGAIEWKMFGASWRIKKNSFGSLLQQTETVLLAQRQRDRMHAIAPNYADMRARPT